MKCPKCNGTGKSEIGVGAFTIHGADCDRCNGKGIIEPMTNEEWLRQANTEQLAEKLWELYNVGKDDAKTYDTFEYFIDKEDVLEWLKQPHKEN